MYGKLHLLRVDHIMYGKLYLLCVDHIMYVNCICCV